MRVFLIALLLLITATSFAQDRVQVLAHAIAKAEGYGVKGSLSTRYRNPGDMKAVKGYVYPGQVGIGKAGHVRFCNDAAGWAALTHQIEKIIAGDSRYSVNMTLKEISKRYAGNSRVWARNVAHNLGVDPETTLWEILEVPPALEKSRRIHDICGRTKSTRPKTRQ